MFIPDSRVGAWPNSVDWRLPRYCVASLLLQSQRHNVLILIFKNGLNISSFEKSAITRKRRKNLLKTAKKP